MSISPRKQPKQARAQARVKRILNTAERLLANEGYENFSTNRVAKEADVNIASLYQYFPNKQALIFAINRNMLDDVLELFETFEQSWSCHNWRDVFDILNADMLTSNQHIRLVKALDQAAAQSPELQAMEQQHAERVSQFYSRFLAHYGSCWTDSDRLNAGRMIYAMGTMGLYDAGHLPKPDQQRILQLFKMNIEQFVDSILNRPAPFG